MSEDLIYPEEIVQNNEKIYKKIGMLHMGATLLFVFLTIGMIVGLQDSNVIPTTSFAIGTNGPVGFPSQQLYLDNQFNPVWFIFIFVLLAALDHGLIWYLTVYHQKLVEKFLFERKNNPIRWIEYSISASLMLITICILCGVSDIFLWVLLGSSNCIGMLMGQVLEMLSSPRYKNVMEKSLVKYIFSLTSAMVFVPWVVPMYYFFHGLATTNENVPSFVYIALLGIFVCFSSFGLNSFCYHILEKYDFHTTEYIYVILSFVAKTILAVDVYGGLASVKK
jgi:hypothetical protein